MKYSFRVFSLFVYPHFLALLFENTATQRKQIPLPPPNHAQDLKNNIPMNVSISKLHMIRHPCILTTSNSEYFRKMKTLKAAPHTKYYAKIAR
jgi:hypothetical protein